MLEAPWSSARGPVWLHGMASVDAGAGLERSWLSGRSGRASGGL